jgi:hypothetical protein
MMILLLVAASIYDELGEKFTIGRRVGGVAGDMYKCILK